jgi:hypothetical protein
MIGMPGMISISEEREPSIPAGAVTVHSPAGLLLPIQNNSKKMVGGF